MFFYSDVEHEILPVTSGNRLTLAYDVYASDHIQYKLPVSLQAPVDVKSTALYPKLSAMLADVEFLPNGGKLAIGLAYEYPVQEASEPGATFNALFKGERHGSATHRWTVFLITLKGSDHALWNTLAAIGLKGVVRAVYEPTEYTFGRPWRDMDLEPVDQFSSL